MSTEATDSMRKLYVVPIIHNNADLGTLATAIDQASQAQLGQQSWLRHQDTVDAFWDSIAGFMNSFEVAGFNLYQDGLIADGEMGMRIVEQGVKDGSKNYAIIAHLLQNGARLIRTEDFYLVKTEYDLLKNVIDAKSTAERIAASLKFKLAAEDLLAKRDQYIAERIDETLSQGESGILFIGAYHNIIQRLPHDIEVQEVKETRKVREYHLLHTETSHSNEGIGQLEAYLMA
ncbi:MAG: hypothetical protein PHV74_10840, partial [Dehalococcoidia bacterium]|nr:hypothetical protein [Dehalococcoidia bacterium]